MIFVTLGNQNFQFTRLLNQLEISIRRGIINEEVIAQIGYTEFQSDLFKTIKFLGKEEFDAFISQSNFVISHAGTGSIINCLKKGKKIIVAARQSRFNEHIDDHQNEILKAFMEKNLIIGLDDDLKNFQEKILRIEKIELEVFESNNNNFNKELIKIIDKL